MARRRGGVKTSWLAVGCGGGGDGGDGGGGGGGGGRLLWRSLALLIATKEAVAGGARGEEATFLNKSDN